MSAETQGAETRTGEAPNLALAYGLSEVAVWLAQHAPLSECGLQIDRVHRAADWLVGVRDGKPLPSAAWLILHDPIAYAIAQHVGSEFADRLAAVERELLEARTDRDAYSDDVDVLREELSEVERERDEARRALDWFKEWAATTDTLLDALLIWGGHNDDCWHQRQRDPESECFCGWDYYRVKMQRARAALAARATETPEGR